MDHLTRRQAAEDIAIGAGELALSFFRKLDRIEIESKGHQDFVSEADRSVELYIREALTNWFPDDSIVGEEHAPKVGTSGFCWVIDPIDGTTNFINGIPAWTVVLAGVREARTRIGVIQDACHGETFTAVEGQGARLNGKPIRVAQTGGLRTGTVGIGFSNRVEAAGICRLVEMIVAEGGVFYRNASGALSLAYVADGRLLGYSEEHMNAWDCLAGQLLVAEAGGVVEEQDANRMIAEGGRVIAGAPGVFDDLLRISERAFPAYPPGIRTGPVAARPTFTDRPISKGRLTSS